MPNWCSTNIDFYGKDAKKLYEDIQNWTKEDYEENGFGKTWLGNVVGNSGLFPNLKSGGWPKRRGYISYEELVDDEHLNIGTETAWCPMLQMWQAIIDRKKYDLEIVYSAQEPGCEIFWTNDPVLSGTYSITGEIYDIKNDEYIYPEKEFASKEEILKTFKEIFEAKDIVDLLTDDVMKNYKIINNIIEDSDKGEFLSLNETEITEIEEID